MRDLADVGSITTDGVTLPGTDVVLDVTRPTDTDRLLDRSASDPEQNLPYWAEIWPSGIALAAAIHNDPGQVAGRRCIELGCGLGITAAVALAHGADLTATDYAPESLILTRINTLRHSGREPTACLRLNWRSPELAATIAGGPFPVVLAADVVYERRDIEPLLHALDTLLAPDGLFWLADPKREPAEIFLELLRKRGWRIDTTRWHGPWADPADVGVTVRTHRITRPETSAP